MEPSKLALAPCVKCGLTDDGECKHVGLCEYLMEKTETSSGEKPDFRQMILNRWGSSGLNLEASATLVCEYIWNTHVLPLQSELTETKEYLRNALEVSKAMTEVNAKLREENASLKRLMIW